MSAWMVGKVALCSTCNYYSLFTTGNLLLTARSADLGNCLLSLMSAWMVGKVAAPAKANMMVPKAAQSKFKATVLSVSEQ
jgi:hypothetical protein